MPAPAHKAVQYLEQLIDSKDEFTSNRAIHEIKKILPDAPDLHTRAHLLSALGIGYSNLHNEEKSLSSHRNAILTDPTLHIHYTNFGVSLQRFGHRREALEQFLLAVEHGGDRDPVALGDLALGLWENGLTAEALDTLSEALSFVDPANTRQTLTVARVAAVMGQDRAGLTVLARLVAAHSGVTLDVDNPARTVRSASPTLEQAIKQSPALARLIVGAEVASLLAEELRSLTPTKRFVTPDAAAVEAETRAFYETAPMRARASSESIGDEA